MPKWLSVTAAGIFAVFGLDAGHSAEITILASQGSISGARDLAAGFQSATGHKVTAVQEANVMTKVNAGAPADLVVANPPVIDDLIKQGKVVGARVDYARAGIGVAIKAGAPKPPLRNTEDFVNLLRNAKSIGYSTVGSGLMAANVIKSLGLTEELKARTKFLDGFPAAEAVARGEVEIALQQINVILPVAGAELAGPLPPELQQYNDFAVGVLAVSKERDIATAMAKFMGAPENVALVRKSGLEPPAR
ncbi:MAG: molybdate transport system substrate-binding protein [Alphaproteobacteria bacterium]|jgi:molybdate transport system substrate-binding protein|nr:molybdate transport system substrate-binding protein [Alphaproteobacteria bacterium]